jgi:hypothetical protein
MRTSNPCITPSFAARERVSWSYGVARGGPKPKAKVSVTACASLLGRPVGLLSSLPHCADHPGPLRFANGFPPSCSRSPRGTHVGLVAWTGAGPRPFGSLRPCEFGPGLSPITTRRVPARHITRPARINSADCSQAVHRGASMCSIWAACESAANRDRQADFDSFGQGATSPIKRGADIYERTQLWTDRESTILTRFDAIGCVLLARSKES